MSEQPRVGDELSKPSTKWHKGQDGIRATAKVCEETSDREGYVLISVMARILGLTKSQLQTLTLRNHVKWIVRNNAKWFHVDDTLRLMMTTKTPCPPPPLTNPKSVEADDCRWALDALALGPWNCATAASGHAWLVYLDAKKKPAMCYRLMGLFYRAAAKQLAAGAAAEEDQSVLDPPVGEQRAIDLPVLTPTAAEIALQALDDGVVAGPFAIDGEGY